MTPDNVSPDAPSPPSADELLRRMRSGDREASGAFVVHFGELIRLRVRDKLSAPLRRVVDSEDVLSTVARRLDELVYDRRLRAETDRELWSLVMRITKNVVSENVRMKDRHQRAAAAAREIGALRGENGAPDAEAVDVGRWALESLEDGVDRTILRGRLSGAAHREIAASLGATPASVRMRWGRIVRALRDASKEKIW